MKKTASILEVFHDQVVKIGSPLMRESGFKLVDSRGDDQFFLIDYQCCDLYVRFSASNHPQDGVPHFNVLLGEGSREFPACDHNCVALWRMKQLINKDSIHTEYVMTSEEDLHHNVIKAVNELQNYHGGFMNGCLSFFRQALKVVNAERRAVHC